jgi:hypothetical protein
VYSCKEVRSEDGKPEVYKSPNGMNFMRISQNYQLCAREGASTAVSITPCDLINTRCPFYGGVSKIFRKDAVKTIKLTIRPIGRHHPRSSSLSHVDTGPLVSSIFRTLRGSSFLPECQALSAIRSGSPQWYQTGFLSTSILFLEIGRSHKGAKSGEYGGWQLTTITISPETAG